MEQYPVECKKLISFEIHAINHDIFKYICILMPK